MSDGRIGDGAAKDAQSAVDRFRDLTKGVPGFDGKLTLPPRVPDAKLKVARDHLKVAKGTEGSIAQLVELTQANVALAEASIEASKNAARFSRIIAFVSLGIAIASLSVAVVSLVAA